jgi:hypothetical protein
VTYTICEVTCCAENRAGAPSNFNTGLGEHSHAVAARYQFSAELLFEFVDLHGDRRLTDCTLFRRPTEVPMSGQCIEVPKLPKGKHIDNSPGTSI